MSKLQKTPPAWHAEAAAELNRDFAETEKLVMDADRRSAYLGLKFQYVKERGKADGSIPFGQFGNWLKQHCPTLSRRSIGRYCGHAKSLCKCMGWQIGQLGHFETPPHKLLLAAPEELKPTARKEQQLLLELVDDKAKFQRVTEYKQMKEGADVGEQKPQVGQKKGSKGLTKEMRLKHTQVTDAERLKALKLWLETQAEKLMYESDLNGIGRIDETPGGAEALVKFDEAVDFYVSFRKGLAKSRGGAK